MCTHRPRYTTAMVSGEIARALITMSKSIAMNICCIIAGFALGIFAITCGIHMKSQTYDQLQMIEALQDQVDELDDFGACSDELIESIREKVEKLRVMQIHERMGIHDAN